MQLENRGLEDFKPGIYLHYKGILFEADHLMRDANDGNRVGVHYIGLNAEGAKDGPRYMIRTWEDWCAWVHRDGTVCDTHKDETCLETGDLVMRRFRYLGPFYVATMWDEKVIKNPKA